MTLWQTFFRFEGRIGRAVFWLSLLAVALLDLAVVALISDWVHNRYVVAQAPRAPSGSLIVVGLGFVAVMAVSAWIGLALKIKRAHDVDRGGWWLLIALVPVYGPIRLLIDLGFRAGSKRRNRFGPPAGHLGDIDDVTPELERAPRLPGQPAQGGSGETSGRAVARPAAITPAPARVRRTSSAALAAETDDVLPANDSWPN